ncbi:MAG: hypothetical protein AB8G11_07460 [Saprospiraceae bacterium]
MREKLIIRLEKFEHNNDTPIDILLINGEEVELYLSGKDGLFWITNKRLVIAYKATEKSYSMSANRYETFQYINIFSFAVDMIDDASYNVLNIDFKNEFQLQIFIDKIMPIADIAQVLTTKILH